MPVGDRLDYANSLLLSTLGMAKENKPSYGFAVLPWLYVLDLGTIVLNAATASSGLDTAFGVAVLSSTRHE